MEPSMRTRHAALATVVLAALAAPLAAEAVVVVRHPVYVHPRPVVVVAPAPVYVAPAPVYYAPPPPPAAPAPPPATAQLPIDSTMWSLPSGCTKVSLNGETYFQCGPNLLKPLQSEKGTYYAVVRPPP